MNGVAENGNLLVIGHSYNWFQKDTIDGLSEYFNKIEVLVRRNPFAEIANIIPINGLDRYRKCIKIEKAAPANVHVTGIPIWYLPLDRSYKELGERHYKAVKKVIRKDRASYDAIHSHFLWTAGYVGAKLKEDLRIPFVVTAHGDDIYSLPFKSKEWQKKIEYVLNSADHIITVSQSNLRCIKEINVSAPVSVIPNGFREDVFYPRDIIECRKLLGLPLERKIVLAVANLEPVKGLEHLIKATGIMVKCRTDILCIIIGSGSKHNALMKQINQEGLEKNVLLVGGKPHEEIPIWMGSSDVIVLSSLNEGNPTVMFEALGCGRPFVGTRVGGIPEVICSDEYGKVVEAGDPNELSQALDSALDRKWNTAMISEYSMNFTWKRITLKIAKIIQSFF